MKYNMTWFKNFLKKFFKTYFLTKLKYLNIPLLLFLIP